MADTTIRHEEGEPWQWPETYWRQMVERTRGGRSLLPAAWPNGARCAVALSFTATHETIPLRDKDPSQMRLSQGQYGNRRGVPRLRALLQHEAIPATFFHPAVAAILHPDEIRGLAADGHEVGVHSWIAERNDTLPYEAERDLTLRAADVLARLTGAYPLGMRCLLYTSPSPRD